MKLKVADVMTRTVISIRAEAPIDDAFDLLLRHNLSGLPVVDADHQVIGVISERDLLGMLYEVEKMNGIVNDFASKNVITLREDGPLLGAVDLLLARSFRRLPVVDDKNRLVGLVSRRDLIRFIRDVRIKISGALEKKRHAEPAATPGRPAELA